MTATPTARTIDVATLRSRLDEDAPRIGAAVGASLAVAAISNTCALGMALAKMPWNRPAADIDVDAVLRALSNDA